MCSCMMLLRCVSLTEGGLGESFPPFGVACTRCACHCVCETGVDFAVWASSERVHGSIMSEVTSDS